MIKKISFNNYKSFEKGEIELKPITILLGANSVGKSSIINLLLMLQQTANANYTNYKSALRLHGENVSMGESRNIFRNKDTSKNIIIDFEFENSKLMDLLTKKIHKDFVNHITMQIYFFSRFPKGELKQINIELNKFLNKNGELNERIYKEKAFFKDVISTIETIKKNEKFSDVIKHNFIQGANLSNVENIELIYDLLSKIKEIKEASFKLSFELRDIKSKEKSKEGDVIKMRKISLSNNNKLILSIEFEFDVDDTKYKNITIKSDFTEEKEILDDIAKKEFLKLINYDSTIFSWVPHYNDNFLREYGFFSRGNSKASSIMIQIIINIIEQSVASIKNDFAKKLINHVSPLRAHPKRYYFLDKGNINTTLDTFDGNSLTEILKEENTVKEKVNKWLSAFGFQVDVSTLQDIIHKLKIKQYSLDLDITDVGFGLSQILPIIVHGFWSLDNSLTMIEQPEIHLHPKMQAELADLFIDIAIPSKKNPKKYLLIETHSEYLLKRLMRRISEGKILKNNVSIYFIEPPNLENSSATIIKKEISKEGAFEWPKDFYEGELKKDTTNFIKQFFSWK